MKKIISAVEQVEWLKQPDNVVSYTHTFKKSGDAGEALIKDEENRKFFKSGSIYPKNDKTAEGIILSDVEVTDGDNIGALMVHGDVVEQKLPETINAEAKYVLMQKGIYFFADNQETLVTRKDC